MAMHLDTHSSGVDMTRTGGMKVIIFAHQTHHRVIYPASDCANDSTDGNMSKSIKLYALNKCE